MPRFSRILRGKMAKRTMDIETNDLKQSKCYFPAKDIVFSRIRFLNGTASCQKVCHLYIFKCGELSTNVCDRLLVISEIQYIK